MGSTTHTSTRTVKSPTRACMHKGCVRKGKAFKTAEGRRWHLTNIHGVGVTPEPAPAPESAPEPEHVKLEGQRLEDDRALRGPATVKVAKTRRTRHEGNVACMNVHRGTHAAWLDAQASTPDVVAEAEAIVAETPEPTIVKALEVLTLGLASVMERLTELQINSRANA